MPYSYPDNLPTYIKNLPAGAQKIFVAAFNSVLDDGGSEDKARRVAWAAVKKKYKKNYDGVNDLWVEQSGFAIRKESVKRLFTAQEPLMMAKALGVLE